MAGRAMAIEERIIEVAREDVTRAKALCVDRDVTRMELISALLFLSHSCLAVADVAQCRAERLTEPEG